MKKKPFLRCRPVCFSVFLANEEYIIKIASRAMTRETKKSYFIAFDALSIGSASKLDYALSLGVDIALILESVYMSESFLNMVLPRTNQSHIITLKKLARDIDNVEHLHGLLSKNVFSQFIDDRVENRRLMLARASYLAMIHIAKQPGNS